MNELKAPVVAHVSSLQLHRVKQAEYGERARQVAMSREHTPNRRVGLVEDTDYLELMESHQRLLAALERIADETAATWVCDVANEAIDKAFSL